MGAGCLMASRLSLRLQKTCVVLWAAGFLSLLAGCQTQDVERKPPQLQVRQPLAAAAAVREAGEDCSLNGKSICRGKGARSGECIRMGLPPDEKALCTHRCSIDDECPEAWRCVALLSDGRSEFCLPPPGVGIGVAPQRRTFADAGIRSFDAGVP